MVDTSHDKTRLGSSPVLQTLFSLLRRDLTIRALFTHTRDYHEYDTSSLILFRDKSKIQRKHNRILVKLKPKQILVMLFRHTLHGV